MSGPNSANRAVRPAAPAGRRLAELAARLGVVTDEIDVIVTGVTHDSRAVRPGDLYAALPGSHAHGASFAAQAAAAGAVAVITDADGELLARDSGLAVLPVDDPRLVLGPVASWLYGEPSKQLRALGVTGTNGKTTTSFLLDAGLRAAGETTGLIGTIETRVGDEVAPSVRTTPEASDLQALFATMVERGVSSVSMEVSSHALALHRADGTWFEIVGFTNLSQDHLDFHADLDDYFAAKARLFTPEFAAAGLVNRDDEYGRRLLAAPKIALSSFSIEGDPDAEWRASGLVTEPTGSRFVAHGPGVELGLETRLPGRFNAANALAALAMLASAGIDPSTAAVGIAALPGVPGRMEPVTAGQPFTALVDYAHTPEAVETLLGALRPTTSGRLIVVLGCGGDRDAAKRPLMGAAAARLADVAVLTSDNPRSESPERILDAVVAGAQAVPKAERGEVVVEIDRTAAIGVAVTTAQPGDVVVVAGKGHEQGQEVAGTVHPFDDRVVLRRQLAALGWRELRA